MSEQLPLFEVVDQATFTEGLSPKTRAKRSPKYEPRNLTTWYALDHHFGYCTVPNHEDVQRELNPMQKEYRQAYPTRLLHNINGVDTCRDCYLAGEPK